MNTINFGGLTNFETAKLNLPNIVFCIGLYVRLLPNAQVERLR